MPTCRTSLERVCRFASPISSCPSSSYMIGIGLPAKVQQSALVGRSGETGNCDLTRAAPRCGVIGVPSSGDGQPRLIPRRAGGQAGAARVRWGVLYQERVTAAAPALSAVPEPEELSGYHGSISIQRTSGLDSAYRQRTLSNVGSGSIKRFTSAFG